MAGCWNPNRYPRNYPQGCLSQLHERHSMHLPQSLSIYASFSSLTVDPGRKDGSCGNRESMSNTELARYGTASAACSLLLQHRNATVHNNESGASVTADAWTNVQRTFRVTYSLFCDSCLSPGAILCAAAHYRKDWRLGSELDRIEGRPGCRVRMKR